MSSIRVSDCRYLSRVEPRPFPERRCIHLQHTIRAEHPADPSFQLVRLADILLSADFDTRPISQIVTADKKLSGGHVRNPIQDALMRIGTAQFRNNVGVEKIHEFTDVTPDNVKTQARLTVNCTDDFFSTSYSVARLFMAFTIYCINLIGS